MNDLEMLFEDAEELALKGKASISRGLITPPPGTAGSTLLFFPAPRRMLLIAHDPFRWRRRVPPQGQGEDEEVEDDEEEEEVARAPVPDESDSQEEEMEPVRAAPRAVYLGQH
ncbi:unnamed protein product [Caenorhabditis auriculariae]|uniref:Uncharacterized protein n=1 Tax=Caenorhabditis auriculariae TaxID=2777116 RepID=A0A8S1HTK0_9PELO|nr:unnamed protein product [Caenorhabditis auriculariae]